MSTKERNRLVSYVNTNQPNPYSKYEFAQPNNPTPQERIRTLQTERDIASYRDAGSVKVIPPSAPSPSAAPNSWPPIPTAYVPRPGTLVQLPFETRDFAADQPSPQVQSGISIKRSGRVQKAWNTQNPGQITHWSLNTPTNSTHTTDKVGVSPYPDPPIVEEWGQRGY